MLTAPVLCTTRPPTMVSTELSRFNDSSGTLKLSAGRKRHVLVRAV